MGSIIFVKFYPEWQSPSIGLPLYPTRNALISSGMYIKPIIISCLSFQNWQQFIMEYLLFILTILFALLEDVNACSCFPAHVQTHFCQIGIPVREFTWLFCYNYTEKRPVSLIYLWIINNISQFVSFDGKLVKLYAIILQGDG